MIKTVAIFLDDFSVLSEDMANTYVYDFGSAQLITFMMIIG